MILEDDVVNEEEGEIVEVVVVVTLEEEEEEVDEWATMRCSGSIKSRNGVVATRFINSPADKTQSAASKASSLPSSSDRSSSVKRLNTLLR